jgi:predicted HTH domain antitoxin
MTIQTLELGALVKAGIFHSASDGIEEGLRLLFMTRPQLRIEAAVQIYREGDVTLGRAAEIAGLTRWEFTSLLADRGIETPVPCDSAQALDEQFEQFRQKR